MGLGDGTTPGGRSSEPSGRLKPCMSIPINTPRTSINLGSPDNTPSARAGFVWMISSFCLNEGSARCFAVRGLVASFPRRFGSAKSFPRPAPSPLGPAESCAVRRKSISRYFMMRLSPVLVLNLLHLGPLSVLSSKQGFPPVGDPARTRR